MKGELTLKEKVITGIAVGLLWVAGLAMMGMVFNLLKFIAAVGSPTLGFVFVVSVFVAAALTQAIDDDQRR